MKKFLLMIFLIKSVSISQDMSFSISSSISAHFIVTDPFGRKTGYDPRTMGHKLDSIDFLQFREIPNSSYGYDALGSLNSDELVYENFGFICGGTIQEYLGKFKIELIGTETDTFWIGFHVSWDDNEVNKYSSAFIEGVIETDSSIVYYADIPRTLSGKISLTKNINLRSLYQDIQAMKITHWISDSIKADGWIRCLDSAVVFEEGNKRCQAREKLESLSLRISVDSFLINHKGRDPLMSALKEVINTYPICPYIKNINPVITYTGSSAFTLKVIGKNFTNVSTVYWNNLAKQTTLISDSILIANISAGDIAVVDSPLVVVKNPDGGESNALRFYVIKRLTIPELLDTLSSHLQLCYTNGWLGNKQFKEVLERNIQNAKSKYLRQDSIGCTQELEELQQNIRNEYLSKPKKNDKRYINGEAYQLLTSDITNIISNVLTLPPRTSGTIYAQISALQTELKKAETEQQIGGELLIPALNLLLETSKKQIQRKDTTIAALQIRLFQQTIKEVYELTQKWKKTKDRIYITATAYISLYYRAEYILEQLTEINNQPLPKLESELEKELQELRKEIVE